MALSRAVTAMSESQEADFTCPFCGRDYDGQAELTDHFQDGHGMDGFAPD